MQSLKVDLTSKMSATTSLEREVCTALSLAQCTAAPSHRTPPHITPPHRLTPMPTHVCRSYGRRARCFHERTRSRVSGFFACRAPSRACASRVGACRVLLVVWHALQLEVWKAEVHKLNQRMADDMHARLHGDNLDGYRTTDA